MRNEWSETTLGDVADVVMGQSPPGSSYNERGDGLPFIQGSAEFGDRHPHPIKWCTEPRKVAAAGDLLLSVRAPVGDANFASEEIAIGRGLATVRGTVVASTEFLALALDHGLPALKARSGGGMFESITKKGLIELPVAVPPVAEQRRIVDLIESVDGYIAASRRYEASMEGSIRVLRDALLADHSRRALGDLLESVDGGTSLACPDDPPAPGESRILKLSAVRPEGFAGGEAKRLPADHGLPSRAKVRVGDVLMTRSNTPERVGYASMVTELTAPTYMPDLIFRLVPDRNALVPAYLAEVLNCSEVRAAITASASGTSSSMRKINKTKVRGYSVPVAPRDEQERIVAFLDDARAVARAATEVRRRAESVRTALLADLLSGEHEIPASYDRSMETVG